MDRDTLRAKYPGLAKQADSGRSPRGAIKLYCIECMGGSRSNAATCATQACPLWRYAYQDSRGCPDKAEPKERWEDRKTPAP